MIKITTLLVCITISCTSCSLASYASQEAVAGALGGTVIGSATGFAISRRIGNTSRNVLVNAAIGTGAGLAAGTLLNHRNIKNAKKREVVVREAKLIGKNQLELDRLRQEIYDASSWGNNEVGTWDKIYPATNTGNPHQGSSNYQTRY